MSPWKKIASRVLLTMLAAFTCPFAHASYNDSKYNPVNIGFSPGNNPTPLTSNCFDGVQGLFSPNTIYYGSASSVSMAVNPKNPKLIVACWINDVVLATLGDGLEVGIAYSKNGGKSWNQTAVPFQLCLGGLSQSIGTPIVSYDKEGKKVYLAVKLTGSTPVPMTAQTAVAVTRSKDNGETWKKPILLETSDLLYSIPSTFNNSLFYSSSVTGGSEETSFVVWTSFPAFNTNNGLNYLARTTNGGKTWSTDLIYDPFLDPNLNSNGNPNDVQTVFPGIVVYPEHLPEDAFTRCKKCSQGDILQYTARIYAIPGATDEQYVTDSFPYQFSLIDTVVTRSKDSGAIWDQTSDTVFPSSDLDAAFVFTGGYTYDDNGNIIGSIGQPVKPALGNMAVNEENGNLYAVSLVSTLRADKLPQIGIKLSRDGGHEWSETVQANNTPANAVNPQAFCPNVAVARGGYVGVAYADFRNDSGNPDSTLTDIWLVIYRETKSPDGGSTGIGLDFVREVRLTPQSFIIQNGEQTAEGWFTVGNNLGLATYDKTFYVSFPIAFNGPFTPPTTFFVDPVSGNTILLDDNYRTAPYFQKINAK